MNKTLMIVDDSMFVYEEMKYMLMDSEFNIIEYSQNGEDSLEKYENAKPDLVTMDIILPGIDGMTAADRIIKKYPDARIIVVSSLAYDETIEQAKGLGIKHLLFKPFTKDELLESLKATASEN